MEYLNTHDGISVHDFQLRHQGLQRLGALPHQALQLRESIKDAGFL